MANEMSLADSRQINGYYVVISNLERLGDHAVNLAGYAKELKGWDAGFSETAREELEIMKKQCMDALDIVKEMLPGNSGVILEKASAMEQKIDDTRDKYFKKQMQRLKKGKCKPQTGIIFTEILTDFERMGDHVKNIAEQYVEMEN